VSEVKEVDCDPEQLLGEEGCDPRSRTPGNCRVWRRSLYSKPNRTEKQTVDKAIYVLRNRIERFFTPEKPTVRRNPLRQTHRELRGLCHSCN